MVRITPKDAQDMMNAYSKVYAPKEEPKVEAEPPKEEPAKEPEQTKAEVEIIYQSISDLHASCPDHLGDWYFTGNYPTPGGTKVLNKAFINYMAGKNKRAYS